MLRRQEYIKANPRVSGRELTNIFNIRLGSAKRLLQKYRGERPAKIRKVMNVETKEIFNSVKLAAISVNGAPANIYVACKNDMLTAYGYHWKFIDNEN